MVLLRGHRTSALPLLIRDEGLAGMAARGPQREGRGPQPEARGREHDAFTCEAPHWR